MTHIVAEENVEVWGRLPGAPLRNSVKGCNEQGHFDSERVPVVHNLVSCWFF